MNGPSLGDYCSMLSIPCIVIGTTYMAYDFLARPILKTFARMITHMLIGFVVLAIIGFGVYLSYHGWRDGFPWRGFLTYGMLGSLVGMLVSMSTSRSSLHTKPRLFFWKKALLGSLCACPVWVIPLYPIFLTRGIGSLVNIEGILWSGGIILMGGFLGGFSPILYWKLLSSSENCTLPWKKRKITKSCLCGLFGALFTGAFGFYLSLWQNLSLSLIEVLAIASYVLIGGVIGSLGPSLVQRHFSRKSLPPLDEPVAESLKMQLERIQAPLFWSKNTQALISRGNSSLKSIDVSPPVAYTLFPEATKRLERLISSMEFNEYGIIVPRETINQEIIQKRYPHKQSQEERGKPHVFSSMRALIGLIMIYPFGLFWAFLNNIEASALFEHIPHAHTFMESLIGALINASLVGLGGFFAGGLSAYIFWWVDHLANKRLGMIGFIITIIGVSIERIPAFINLLNAIPR